MRAWDSPIFSEEKEAPAGVPRPRKYDFVEICLTNGGSASFLSAGHPLLFKKPRESATLEMLLLLEAYL